MSNALGPILVSWRHAARGRAPRRLLLLVALPFVAACTSTPETVPLTEQEKQDLAWLNKLDPKAGKVAERGTLFTSLDQNIRTWRSLTTSTEVGDIAQRDSIEQALTKQAYNNFDTILDELQHGTDPEHKITAAAALGFSRIPAPGEPGARASLPPLHEQAVRPLLACVESGNDQLVMNALLSIGRIAAADTPRDILVELMVTHHNEDVRTNAALALSRIIGPADGPLCEPPLFSALSDSCHKVRLHAVKALGRIGDRSAQPQLLNVLRKDEMPLVQACAALELGRIGDVQAIDALIDGLQSNRQIVVYECQSSLLKITGETERRDHKHWVEWWNADPRNPANAKRGG